MKFAAARSAWEWFERRPEEAAFVSSHFTTKVLALLGVALVLAAFFPGRSETPQAAVSPAEFPSAASLMPRFSKLLDAASAQDRVHWLVARSLVQTNRFSEAQEVLDFVYDEGFRSSAVAALAVEGFKANSVKAIYLAKMLHDPLLSAETLSVLSQLRRTTDVASADALLNEARRIINQTHSSGDINLKYGRPRRSDGGASGLAKGVEMILRPAVDGLFPTPSNTTPARKKI